MKPKVYMAGPIQHTQDYNGWREELPKDFPEIEWLNPLHKYDTQVADIEVVSDDFDLQDVASGKTPVTCSQIVEGDKEMINRSDGIIVNWDTVPSCGTPMEVSYVYDRNKIARAFNNTRIPRFVLSFLFEGVWRKEKPIVVVYDEPSRISPWMEYHADYLTSSLTDGALYLQGEIFEY